MKMETSFVSTRALCTLFFVVTLSYGTPIVDSIAESKSCSKYDFEEKLLEKLVRLEHAMEVTQDRMKNLKTTIDKKMKKYNENIKRLQLEDVKKEEKFQFMLDKMTKQLADNKIALDDIMENFTSDSEVIFRNVTERYGSLSKVVLVACNNDDDGAPLYKSGSTYKFPTIVTKVGLPNLTTFTSTGKFICPVSGIYHISAVLTTNADYVGIYIMKNAASVHGQFITGGYTGNDWAPGTAIIALELNANDSVWIKTNKDAQLLYSCLTIFKL